MKAAELTEQIASHYAQPEQAESNRSVGILIRRLAEGTPITHCEVAKLLGYRELDLDAYLARLPFRVELDEQGRVVGAGLTLRPTHHQFIIDGKHLFTWCALDALIFPVLLDQTVQVMSLCASTGRTVSATISPHGICAVDPPGTVVSIVSPEDDCMDVRLSFCVHVNFFISQEAAQTWNRKRPASAVLNLDEAFELAKKMARSFGSMGICELGGGSLSI